MNTDLMTIEQAAEYLQVSRETLYKYAQTSKVPAAKIGRHWRFSKRSIDAWMHVSAEAEPATPGPSGVAVEPQSERFRVLVVDDEIPIRRLLDAWISQMGHAVQSVPTGAETLELLGRQRFDILFLDLHLEDMTGADILSRLPVADRPAVVLITGNPGGDVMDEALRHPVTYALAKPFQKADVAAVIEMFRMTRKKSGSHPSGVT